MARNQLDIICLPGLFAGSWIWKDVCSALREAGHTPHLIDKPIPVSMGSNLKTAMAVLDDLSGRIPGKPMLVGNSMGALIAFEYARLHPGKVHAIALSGAPGLEEGCSGIGLEQLRSGSTDAIEELGRFIYLDPSFIQEEHVHEVKALFTRDATFQAINRWLHVSRKYPLREHLASCEHEPVLIWGSHDRLTPSRPWTELRKNGRPLPFHEVAEAGHSPMVEQPARFAEALLRSARIPCPA